MPLKWSYLSKNLCKLVILPLNKECKTNFWGRTSNFEFTSSIFLKISSIQWPKSKHTPYTNIIESCLQLNIWQTWILHFLNTVYNWLTVCKAKHEWFFFPFWFWSTEIQPPFCQKNCNSKKLISYKPVSSYLAKMTLSAKYNPRVLIC